MLWRFARHCCVVFALLIPVQMWEELTDSGDHRLCTLGNRSELALRFRHHVLLGTLSEGTFEFGTLIVLCGTPTHIIAVIN